MLVLLGFALLAVVGVVYLLGYRGGGPHPPAETTAVTSTPAPAGFAFTSAEAVGVSSYASSVAWTTSEPSTGRLRWGPVGVKPVLWDSADALSTRHVLRLAGLASSTTYRVSLVATSSAEQHIARTDFSFTTAAAPT